MILFLDLDGVPHGTSDDAQLNSAAELATLLAEFPHVDVVLSTSRRLGRTLDGLCFLLPPNLASRIVGMTPDLSHQSS